MQTARRWGTTSQQETRAFCLFLFQRGELTRRSSEKATYPASQVGQARSQVGQARAIGARASGPNLNGRGREGGRKRGRPARVSPYNYGARCYVGRRPTEDKFSSHTYHSPSAPAANNHSCYLFPRDPFSLSPPHVLSGLGPDMPRDRPETSLPLGGQAGALSLLCLASPLFATANHPPAWNVSSIFCLKARFGRYFAKSFFCQDKFLHLTYVMNSIIQHWQE